MELYRQTGAGVVSLTRKLYRLDGTLLGKCPEVDGERFVDNNCYFITQPTFQMAPVWWMMELLYGGSADKKLGKK